MIIPLPISLPNIHCLNLTTSEIWSGQDFFKIKVITARSKVKSRSNYDEAQLHFLTNVPTKYELSTPYGFRNMARRRFFKVKVIMARSKVKSRSIYDVAQLYTLTNVPTKYQLPTPYGFRDMAQTRFSKVKVIMARSKVKLS